MLDNISLARIGYEEALQLTAGEKITAQLDKEI